LFRFLLPSFLILRPTPIARHVPSFALVLLLLLLHVLLFICYMKNKNYNSFLFSLFSFCFLPSNGMFQKIFPKCSNKSENMLFFFSFSEKIQPKGVEQQLRNDLSYYRGFFCFSIRILTSSFYRAQTQTSLFILSFHYRYSYARLLSALTHTHEHNTLGAKISSNRFERPRFDAIAIQSTCYQQTHKSK
jgi:hypothetical protein